MQARAIMATEGKRIQLIEFGLKNDSLTRGKASAGLSPEFTEEPNKADRDKQTGPGRVHSSNGIRASEGVPSRPLPVPLCQLARQGT